MMLGLPSGRKAEMLIQEFYKTHPCEDKGRMWMVRKNNADLEQWFGEDWPALVAGTDIKIIDEELNTAIDRYMKADTIERLIQQINKRFIQKNETYTPRIHGKLWWIRDAFSSL